MNCSLMVVSRTYEGRKHPGMILRHTSAKSCGVCPRTFEISDSSAIQPLYQIVHSSESVDCMRTVQLWELIVIGVAGSQQQSLV